jgi:hypothetical protein
LVCRTGHNEHTRLGFLDNLYGPVIVFWDDVPEDAPAPPQESVETAR